MAGAGYSLDMKSEAKSAATKGDTNISFGARFGDNNQGQGLTNPTLIGFAVITLIALYFVFKKKK
ncbi:LPXTG cell wall anchor domain-containing protein [Hydrogenovibrio sp. 3SP14C1]|uniref:LPXTG cell wall anchor domain-containing protein n=1 Tax=Hydrogenovibrio sp. 3SP14C1 TaxID=3038774 RepID=UPI002416C0E2|nr:LPXTG cell wall anchor domain-containing protein [Hydrogenovibrio sp. 3SP14C1]MDG4812755.1 LPXTG cell wall anchor domain-containing protein [Hydrogenovibrio sp. 3SP14C1]